MAKRYYLCKIVEWTTPLGATVRGPSLAAPAYRRPGTRKVTEHSGAVNSFGLVLCSGLAADFTAWAADPDSVALPNVTLDTVLTSAQRTAINTALASRGIDLTVPVGWTLGQLVRAIGRRTRADFEEAHLYVPDA